mmetsp:Transcript_39051/g.63279  ORF Transcript_39051/g.63279 Transcript_39051/m.63279 type:complete len:534 (-) Transcript_39051:342-1943(-)
MNPPGFRKCTSGTRLARVRSPSSRPLQKATMDLLSIYKCINARFYSDTRRKRPPSTQMIPQQSKKKRLVRGSLYPWKFGEMLNKTYRVEKEIGKGAFGVVLRAHDTVHGKDVAIKIIKDDMALLAQAQSELAILRRLEVLDPSGAFPFVRTTDNFRINNHQCFVFELLAANAYELIKRTYFRGVSLGLVRSFARQLFSALVVLRRQDVNIIHADIKPENILLVSKQTCEIKLCDFGSSCLTSNATFAYIQSRFYRAPEVILGMAYGVEIDMWSVACVLVELHTGQPLFDGSSEVDQLYKIFDLCGMPSPAMLKRCKRALLFFDNYTDTSIGELRKPPSPLRENDPDATPLIHVSKGRSLRGAIKLGRKPSDPSRDSEMFVDLVSQMLKIDPSARISPEDALRHAFFTETPKGKENRGGQERNAATSKREVLGVKRGFESDIPLSESGPLRERTNNKRPRKEETCSKGDDVNTPPSCRSDASASSVPECTGRSSSSSDVARLVQPSSSSSSSSSSCSSSNDDRTSCEPLPSQQP